MWELLSLIYICIFGLTISNEIKIGYLLLISIVFFLYCLLILFSKTEKLTELGRIIFIISLLGLAYSISILNGISFMHLF